MKRIFLTSGLVLCMACPAFGYVDAGAENCVQPNIGVYEGTTNLKANWTANYTQVVFNENDGSLTAEGGATGDQRPTDIFLVGAEGLYKRNGQSDTDYVFTKLTAGDAVLTAPNGISVNYTLHANASTVSHADSDVTMPTSSAATRVFQGYYASTVTTDNYTGATAMITNGGALTSAGETAALTYDNSTPWKAIYNTVSPTISADPSMPGYQFLGWTTTANGSNPVATVNLGPIGENGDLYAQWQALATTITFNCDTIAAHHTGTPTGSTTQNINMDALGNIMATCALDGWTFTGWTCGAGLTTDSAGQNAVTTIAASSLTGTGYPVYMKSPTGITCTANWTANNIGITYDSAGGTAIPTDSQNPNAWESCDYDGAVVLPTNPTRTGYTFSGWTVNN